MPKWALRLTALLVLPVLAALAARLGGSAASTRATDECAARAAEYAKLRQTYGPALVTVRFVQRQTGRAGDNAQANEINGVMVEPRGLVLCSNAMLGGTRSRWGDGPAVPTDIRVITSDAADGLEAAFVARDTELDLAWLRIKEPGDREFPYVDLANTGDRHTTPDLGARLLALGVMGRYFGQEILVTEGLMAGRTHKPRELYVIRGGLDTDPGLPIFSPDGGVVGFACVQSPDADEMAGSPANLVARGRGLVLPVATVAKATARARDIEVSDASEEGHPEPEEDALEDGEDEEGEGE